jgi:hypothetical protein
VVGAQNWKKRVVIKYPVIYAYDLVTVQADEMVYSKPDSSIRGSGHVRWQNQRESKNGSAFSISFRNNEPRFELTK